MILISNDFWHTIKINNFDPYNVLLAIATNIPVLLMTSLCSRDMDIYFLCKMPEHHRRQTTCKCMIEVQ